MRVSSPKRVSTKTRHGQRTVRCLRERPAGVRDAGTRLPLLKSAGVWLHRYLIGNQTATPVAGLILYLSRRVMLVEETVEDGVESIGMPVLGLVAGPLDHRELTIGKAREFLAAR